MIKSFIKRIIYGNKATSETYINFLRNLGCSIGEGTVVYVPFKTYVDITRPYMIHIGNNVKITQGVTILTHGYDWAVLEGMYHEVLGSAGEVVIGNNVFIGMNTTILKDVHIGNNVIIGAGSLVNKDIPDNSVAAGNPAKVLTTVDQYYEKRKAAQLDEAYCIYKNYCNRWGQKNEPPKECFHEFFWLFNCELKGGEFGESVWNSMMKPNNYIEYQKSSHPFESFKDFIAYCALRYRKEINREEEL